MEPEFEDLLKPDQQDSLLSCQPRKVEPEGRGLRQPTSSRISSASFSSFSMNYLQSPRLKSTEGGVGQVILHRPSRVQGHK